MSRENGPALNRVFSITGTVVLIAILAICSFNFMKDSRLFQKPVLSTTASAAAKDEKNGAADNYKTLKYKKTDSSSSTPSKSSSKKSTPAAPKATKKAAVPNINP
jgi:hypothetical protein